MHSRFFSQWPGCEENGHEGKAREKLASILRDSLGAVTDPQVAFINGGGRDSNLYVHLDTTAFANLSDSAFDARAQEVARFAVRHFDKVSQLDSVTVAARENVAPNSARILHMRTFPIAQLRN